MLKKLKSLFVVEENTGSTGTGEDKKAHTVKNVPDPEPTSSEEIHIDMPEGNISEEFAEILLKSWQSNNLKGFDYLEYKKSLDSLKDMPMDEKTKYQSAFAMAKTMGANPDSLLDTAQHYVDILKGEEEKFEKALDNQRTRKIDEKESEAKALDQSIREKRDKIKALEESIEQDKESLNAVKSDLESAQVKIESTREDFVKTYKFLLAQVLTDMEKMKKYLKDAGA